MAIYKIFDDGNDVISNVKDTVSSGMWENGSGTLTAFYTSSTQSGSSGEHYLDVYGSAATTTTRKPQFSVAYGHFNGSGSLGRIGVDGNRAAASVYRQLSQTLLGPTETQFTFAGTGGNITPKFVYAISVAREFLREKMDPGNWELHISGSGATKLKFIDDSGATTNPTVNQGGRVFNIVSGSIATGTAVTNTAAASQDGGGYGLFYPDLGILVFNGPVLNTSASLATISGSNVNGDNSFKFFERIRVAGKFQARREEVITSQHFFVRIPNQEFNFSSNPTFATSSDGSFTIGSFYKNPKSYITQVGLYNDSNELLAVAKLSKPLMKSFSREALIKVKLDF
jgi:hypothetical protein